MVKAGRARGTESLLPLQLRFESWQDHYAPRCNKMQPPVGTVFREFCTAVLTNPRGRRTIGPYTMLGDFLRQRRQELGLSVREIAKASELTESAIYMIERGERLPERFDTIEGLARAYQTDTDEIARMRKEEPRQPSPNGGRRGKATAST